MKFVTILKEFCENHKRTQQEVTDILLSYILLHTGLCPTCHMQVHSSRNYIPAVKSSPKHTSPSSTVATFLATCLMAVLQPSEYSVFHGRDIPIQLGLP